MRKFRKDKFIIRELLNGMSFNLEADDDDDEKVVGDHDIITTLTSYLVRVPVPLTDVL